MVLMLVQFQTVHASMPITFDSSNMDDCMPPSDCSTLSWSHSVGPGSNPILIVSLSHLGIRTEATSVTFAGHSLSFVGDAEDFNLYVELWSLLDPPSGTGTITASYSSGADYLAGGSVSYFNVAGTRTPASAIGYGTSISVNVASSPYDLVVDSLCLCGNDPGPVSPTSPQTDWFNSGTLSYDDYFDFVGAGSDKPASSPTTSMTWSWPTSASEALVAVPLIPAAATVTSVNCLASMLNVGSSTTCTATVSGTSGTILGEIISWSDAGSVSFSPSNTCLLSGTSCSITVTGTGVGSASVKASYPGDSTNAPSQGTFPITISAAPIPEYPIGIQLLAIFMIIGHAVIKRRTKS